MKFRFVKNPIEEGSYGREINHKEPEIRGEETLREFICDLLSRVCGHYLNADEFMVHHRNGHHNQHSVDNILLLPRYEGKTNTRNYNTRIHNEYRDYELNMDKDDKKYNLMLLYMDAIDVEKSLDSKEIVNVNGDDIWDRLKNR